MISGSFRHFFGFVLGKPQKKGLATKKKRTFFEALSKIPKKNPPREGGGGKALVAGPLKKELFYAAFIREHVEQSTREGNRCILGVKIRFVTALDLVKCL